MAVPRLPECDEVVITRPEIRAIFKESVTEAFRKGSDAFLWEVKLLTSAWEFPLREISQPVALWHGEIDPFSNGHSLAAMLPNCRETFLPEGHLLFFTHWPEILRQLVSL